MAGTEDSAADPLAASYGDVPFEALQSREMSGRVWTQVSRLDASMSGRTVLIRGRCHAVRGKGKISFLVVRETGYTIQIVFQVKENLVSKGLVKFVTSLPKESIVDVEGIVDAPDTPINGTTQQVRSFCRCICRSLCLNALLPFCISLP